LLKEDNVTHRIRQTVLAVLIGGIVAAPVVAPRAAFGTPVQITISHSQQTADFLPLWIASDAGYFKKHGLDATVRYLPAQEGIPALLTGEVQVAGVGGSDASSAQAQGAKLKLVATLTPIYTFQFWARPQYAKAGALKGRRIGVTSTTGSLYSATLLALKQLGLTPSDAILTPLGGVTNVNASLLAGSIAAACSHPPATYKFKQAGLVDLVDLAKKRIPSVSAGLWVTEAYLNAHRDIVQNVVDAVMEALQRERSDRTFAEAELRKYLGVTDKAALDVTYDFYVNEVLARGPMPEASGIAGDVQALAATNPKVKTVDPAAMLDQSFVKNAEQQQAANGAADRNARNLPQ
jgi:NitT/TauT family transport system substrate-binding protein